MADGIKYLFWGWTLFQSWRPVSWALMLLTHDTFWQSPVALWCPRQELDAHNLLNACSTEEVSVICSDRISVAVEIFCGYACGYEDRPLWFSLLYLRDECQLCPSHSSKMPFQIHVFILTEYSTADLCFFKIF